MSEEPGHGGPSEVTEGIPAVELVRGTAVDGTLVPEGAVVGNPVGGSPGDFNVVGYPIFGGPDVPPVPEHPWWVKVCHLYWHYFCAFVGLLIVVLLFAWFILLINRCSAAPAIALNEFTIRDMVVFHDAASNSTLWQVTSDVALALSTRNRNTLVGCSTRLRRMEISVSYKDAEILASGIPEGQFLLKPKKSRLVPAEVTSQRFGLKDQVLGPVLEGELLNDNITLRLEVHTRYLNVFRTSHSTVTTCEVVAMTPLTAFSRLGTLLTKNCTQDSELGF